jgi:plastocyanin
MGYDFAVIEVANCPADVCTDWYQVVVDAAAYPYQEEFKLWGSTADWGWLGTGDFAYYYPGLPAVDDDGWVNGMTVDLLDAYDMVGGTYNAFVPGQFISVRFRMQSDGGWNQRGIKIDDLSIPGLDAELNNGFGTDVDTGVFVETFDNMDNWCTDIMHYGQFWEHIADQEWCATFPDCGGIIDGLIWETEIMDAYEAYLTFIVDFDLGGSGEAFAQISSDGGVTWYTLAHYTGVDTITEHFDITPWAGNDVLIRFLYENHGSAGFICVDELQITGKKDTTAPTSDITMTGTMKDSGWYSTAVSITLTADDEGSGVKEIHYVLDGVETVIAGDTATFTVSGDGVHNIEFWAVDFTGNEGAHTSVPTFRIDSGSPPTVAITAPEPGLYLFGNKLLSASRVIIIGAFTIEATASDAESGIYRVQFYLDGDIICEDTEAPFSAYCAEKHSGAGTIKVVAEDFAQNTAEDTLDITYFKFL